MDMFNYDENENMRRQNSFVDFGVRRSSVKSDSIPFLDGRPERETTISKDEITNLKIALNDPNVGSIEQFVKIV